MECFKYKNLYWIENVICLYIGQSKSTSDSARISFRFVTMDIDDLNKYYEIVDTQQIPSSWRNQAQKDLLKGLTTRRITLNRKDFDYKDIKRVKGQRHVQKTPIVHSTSNKDYESWLTV